MQTVSVKLIQSPFPHVIIEDFYTKDELFLIWQEFNFLISKNKTYQDYGTALREDGSLKASGIKVSLDDIYNDRNASNILTINRKIFDQELLNIIASLHPLMGGIKRCNKDGTFIRYYDEDDQYHPHFDVARFTAISYFYKEPKAFKGGDLFFNEFDYTIPIKNNSVVIFMGCAIEHASTKITLNEGAPEFSGKYSMVQFMDYAK